MGCTPSKKESIRETNLKAMKKNLANGKDAMGHDKGIPGVTPNTPEAAIQNRQMHQSFGSNSFFGTSMCALSM